MPFSIGVPFLITPVHCITQTEEPFNLAIIILQSQSNRLADLKPLVPKVLEVLATVTKGTATVVSL